MRGWLPGRVLSGSLNGSGPAGGLPLRKGRAADCRALLCGVVGCLVLGVEDTLTAGGLLGLLWSWWPAGGGCPCVRWCVWGWHAVGVLGQCALVAWPVWGS